jgi:hypothetical protein
MVVLSIFNDPMLRLADINLLNAILFIAQLETVSTVVVLSILAEYACKENTRFKGFKRRVLASWVLHLENLVREVESGAFAGTGHVQLVLTIESTLSRLIGPFVSR